MTLSICCRAEPLVIFKGITEATIVCRACGKPCDTITESDHEHAPQISFTPAPQP